MVACVRWSWERSFAATGVFPCNYCTRVCESWTALQVHKARVHDFRRPERCRIDTPWRPICLVHFGSRIRVLRHLCRSTNLCRPLILRTLRPLGHEQVEALDAADSADRAKGRKSGFRDGVWRGRAIQLAGPMVLEACVEVDEPILLRAEHPVVNDV